MELNLTSCVLLTRALVPGMKARGGGSIVNIASLYAAVGRVGMGQYDATKAAFQLAQAGIIRLRVDDVLELGQPLEVTVDEIDDKGKVSLVPVGDMPEQAEGSSSGSESGGGDAPAASGGAVEVSFEDSFDAELAEELGDLLERSEL